MLAKKNFRNWIGDRRPRPTRGDKQIDLICGVPDLLSRPRGLIITVTAVKVGLVRGQVTQKNNVLKHATDVYKLQVLLSYQSTERSIYMYTTI